MSSPRFSLMDVHHLHPAVQDLLKETRRRAIPADILVIVSRMSLLQIDTINTVTRSPYLVLSSRLDDYSPQRLDDLLQQDELTEYWAYGVCFLPRSDLILMRHRVLAPESMGWKYKMAWVKEYTHEIEQLLQHIQYNGPVRSVDFEHPRKGTSGWQGWEPQKRHLGGLLTAGKAMVVERRNLQ